MDSQYHQQQHQPQQQYQPQQPQQQYQPQPQSQQQQRPENLSRSKSSFSFRSHKSDKSTSSKPKLDLTETENEKRRSRFNQKAIANPNRAIIEDQPAVRAQVEEATILPLRSIQHKDWNTGTLITDPDASNPSRSRLERPLDTIRSFEAAADGGRSRRGPPTRTESADAATAYSSRRSSVVGGYESTYTANPRYTNANGYDVSRRPSYGRPLQDYGRGPPSSYGRRGIGPRMSSAPTYGRPPQDQAMYNNHAYHESYDTFNTGESSQSEPWGNSTDPSSENSSLDRIHAVKNTDFSNDAYGSQYSQGSNRQGPIAEEGRQDTRAYQAQPYYNGAPSPNPNSQMNGAGNMRYPPPPQPNQPNGAPRPVMKLGPGKAPSGPSQRTPYGQDSRAYRDRPLPNPNDPKRSKLEKKPAEKPKSWLKKRFSKA